MPSSKATDDSCCAFFDVLGCDVLEFDFEDFKEVGFKSAADKSHHGRTFVLRLTCGSCCLCDSTAGGGSRSALTGGVFVGACEFSGNLPVDVARDGFFVAAEPREDFGNHLGGVNAAPDDVAGGKRCRFIRIEDLLGAQEKCGCF